MSSKLSRDAQLMIASVLPQAMIEKDRVVVGPIVFLLNNRAIEYLNASAFENAGQYQQLPQSGRR